jgi:hypothetical protein
MTYLPSKISPDIIGLAVYLPVLLMAGRMLPCFFHEADQATDTIHYIYRLEPAAGDEVALRGPVLKKPLDGGAIAQQSQ